MPAAVKPAMGQGFGRPPDYGPPARWQGEGRGPAQSSRGALADLGDVGRGGSRTCRRQGGPGANLGGGMGQSGLWISSILGYITCRLPSLSRKLSVSN